MTAGKVFHPSTISRRLRHDRPSFGVRHFVYVLSATASLAILMQLLLGAGFFSLVLASACIALGLTTFAWVGANNLGGWLTLFYLSGNVLVALYAKTVMGQPLDSNLFSPDTSFLVQFIATACLCFALVAVQLFAPRKPILEPVQSLAQLRLLTFATLGLGIVFWYMSRNLREGAGDDFGGVDVFRDLLLMAVIARTAYVISASNRERVLDAPLACIIALSLLAGFIDDSKTRAALPVLSFFATVLFFGGRLRASHIAAFLIGSLLFVTFVAPMLTAYRKLGVYGMTISERVGLIADSLALVFSHDKFGQFDQLARDQFSAGYYHYFGVGQGQIVLGRYASIQQIDPVIAAISRREPLGGSAVWPAIGHLVPRFLYPDKPDGTQAYQIVSALGLYDPVGGKYPTLPLAGQAFAAYGLAGVIIISFGAFFVLLFVWIRLGWNLTNNVYAIFFLCQFIIVFGSQGDFGQYLGEALRTVPIFTILFLIIKTVVRSRTFRRRVSVSNFQISRTKR